jgi:multiple sugar transport system ATP-binding protein
MATVTLENLTKKFENTIAADNLNLNIEDGEFVVLLGPSGCGKTTTLRLIAGLELPTEGKVYMNGVDITYVHPKNRKVSMVFQSYALYPHMSVFDNIAFPLKMKKLPKNEIRSKVRRAADLLQIKDLLDRKPKELSGGQRQRVALGRAIIKEPEVFLMDEPLSNVDAKLRTYLRGELKTLQRDLGITTIYVTHDQVEAMSIADRIVVMDKGKIQQVSPPSELYSNPTTSFVASFIGSPPTNLIDCSLVEKNGKIFLDAETFRTNVSDLAGDLKTRATSSELFLGIRPENIRLLQGKVKGRPDFAATVHAAEPLGTETIAILKVGDKLLRTRVQGDLRANIGDEVGVVFDKQQIYVFDRKTGERLL